MTTKRAHDCHAEREFRPLGIAVLVVSDTRDLRSDKSGLLLAERCQEAGHVLVERTVVLDEADLIQQRVLEWSGMEEVHTILITGGTGVFKRDVTPEAVEPLFDKKMPGFGELFRYFSFEEIGTATLESRATAGIVNKTLVFAIPGSSGACRLAIDKLILPQLDSRTKPCSIAGMLDRL